MLRGLPLLVTLLEKLYSLNAKIKQTNCKYRQDGKQKLLLRMEYRKLLRELKDSTPFLRGIVAELGYERKEIPYKQEKRRAGKSTDL